MSFVVIIGQLNTHFLMVMPGTVGPFWNYGLLEIGSIVFFTGLFIFVVMSALSKLKLIPNGNPFLQESIIYEYPF